MKLKTRVAGIELKHPIMNAAGTCKFIDGPDGVREFAKSSISAIMVGSITLLPRPGNEGEVYWYDGKFSLNSIGLRNPGVHGDNGYIKALPEMAKICHDAGKPLFVTVAGFDIIEYAPLVIMVFEAGADMVEVNLGCPNIWDGGKQKQIACFNQEMVDRILCSVEESLGVKARVAVKLSPFSDPFALENIAAVIKRYSVVKAVTTSNTFPNAFSFNEEGKPRITPVNGLAGLGGPALKPIALGQVVQLRAILPKHIDIIGVGGINSGKDVLDFLRAGAKAVQIGTALLERKAKVIDQLLLEFINEEELANDSVS